jgi:hypothetical protein
VFLCHAYLLTRCDSAVLSRPQPETAHASFCEALPDSCMRLVKNVLGTQLQSGMEVSLDTLGRICVVGLGGARGGGARGCTGVLTSSLMDSSVRLAGRCCEQARWGRAAREGAGPVTVYIVDSAGHNCASSSGIRNFHYSYAGHSAQGVWPHLRAARV